MTTAEYAVGTLASIAFAGLLLKVALDNRTLDLIFKIFTQIFDLIFKLIK